MASESLPEPQSELQSASQLAADLQPVAAHDVAHDAAREANCIVVGVGASAGGLDAYKRFLHGIPDDSGMAFVLIQHLDPTHNSLMVELLSKHTSMPIAAIHHEQRIEADHVYMIPPNCFVSIDGQRLLLERPVTRRGVRLPIDHFFRSLASERQARSISVVLSGTGSDGAEGLREIKAEGGMTIAQTPEDAEHDGMPRSAIHTRAVDFVLTIDEMADVILPYAKHPYVKVPASTTLADSDPDEFRAILSVLKAHTDQDFVRYKRGTVTRRIERRMGIRHIETPKEYLELLRRDTAEVHSLFQDMLIGVTRFFRDVPMWNHLKEILSMRILAKRDSEPIRIWIPGCSSGEEAYSLAMLLFDQQERQRKSFDVQVFATDIDMTAIERARAGVYSESVAKDIPDDFIDAYFHREGEKLKVRKRMRESVVFAVQNLLSDPPFSNLDIISCRNLMIYLEPQIQKRIFDVFHFALKPEGILVLGSSESPNKQKELFKPLAQSSRIYEKMGDSRPGSNAFPADGSKSSGRMLMRSAKDHSPFGMFGAVEGYKKALLDEFAPAAVVVDAQGSVKYIHGPVRKYLDFPVGEPSLDITTMAMGVLRAKVRTALHKARATSALISARAPRLPRDTGHVNVLIRVQPIAGVSKKELDYLISFEDETHEEEAAPPSQAVERVGETNGSGKDDRLGDQQLMLELEATREDLQSTIEEMESANEELKASNEEVMSMNEELQSTNEELETSREELQSLNEELSTVNNQLHDKVGELETTSNDLANLLASTDMATLFLDPELRIRRFTPATVRLMSLIDTDVGRPLSDLAPRVNDPHLVSDARQVLDRLSPIEREVNNGDRIHYLRRVMPFRTSDNKIEGVVVTYSDVTKLRQACEQLELRESQQAVIALLGRTALTDEDSSALLEMAARSAADTLGVPFAQIEELDEGRRRLRMVAGVGWSDGVVGESTVATGIESQGGCALHFSSALIVSKLSEEKRFRPQKILIDHEIVCGMSALIGPEGNPWGVFSVHDTALKTFTVDDTNFISAVANVLFEALQRRESDAIARQQLAEIDVLYRSAPVGLCFLDRDLRFVRINEDLAAMNGRSVEEHLGRRFRDVLPELAEKLEPTLYEVLESGQAAKEMEIHGRTPASSKQGGDWLARYAPLIVDGDVVGINSTVIDITERKTMEANLRDSRSRLQHLVDSASVGIAFAKDDGTVVEANDAMLAIFDISREDFHSKGWDWQDSVLPSDERFGEQMRQLGEAPLPQSIELHRRDAHDEKVWVLASARRIELSSEADYIAFMVDITPQKRAELALARGERRLRDAAQMAGFGEFEADLREGSVECSPELRAILGLEEEGEPISMTQLESFLHEDELDRVMTSFRESVDPKGEGRLEILPRIVRQDGSERFVLIHSRTVFRGKGDARSARHIYGFGMDVTERQLFEQELIAARAAADAANEAKSLFLANMSHEIRTPMTSILGYADVLETSIKDPDDLESIRTIRQNGDHLCQILNDILDLAKIESGKIVVQNESCHLLGTVAHSCKLMSVRATEKRIRLSTKVDGMVPELIKTDAKMLRQILLNLIGNAIKFTNEGEVTIEVRHLPEENFCEVSVVDTGIGIPSDRVDSLFDAFEQVDNSSTRRSGGTGLGLSITKKLVGLIGGELHAVSEPDHGSTFSFTLATGPLEDVEWVDEYPSSDPYISDSTRFAVDGAEHEVIKGRILAADDRRDIRFLIQHFLEEAGAEVVSVKDGRECVQTWEANRDSNPFDAVVVDVQMPEMDGLEATRRLRAAGYRGPIIALTANALTHDQAQCFEAGCDDFISKPIDRVQFIGVLANWMRRSHEGR